MNHFSKASAGEVIHLQSDLLMGRVVVIPIFERSPS